MRRPAAGDTLRRPARLDTVRTTRDSITVAAPARPDSAARARIDSIPGLRDSLPTQPAPRDSIKAPIAAAELPVVAEAGQPYRWTRDSLFATGTLTALDLLERVPGVTGFRTGWLASLQNAAYLGDFRRLRVFRDGVELDPLDPRSPGVLELQEAQLWQLEEVLIERAAGEIRVHLRTWAVRNTTPATRVDIATGDDDTNLYRGFFGRRFNNGALFQVAAQNFGTGARNRRTGGGGDAVSAFARLGWARGRLSVDAYLSRLDRQRNATFAFNTSDTILTNFEGRRDEGYLRIGVGTPDRGAWAQAIANVARFTLEGTSYPATRFVPVRNAAGDSIDVREVVAVDTTFDAAGTPTGVDTLFVADSAASRAQYVLTGGFTRWGVRLSAADRWRVFNGRNWHAPSVRAAYERPWGAVTAFVERRSADSTTQADLSARVQPLRWLALLGGYSRTTQEQADSTGTAQPDLQRNVLRLEAAARFGRLWLSGGRLIRDGGAFAVPRVYVRPDSAPFEANPLPLTPFPESRAQGTIVSAHGRVYKDIVLDVNGLAWDAGGAYRPQYQLRAEVRLETNWLRRFPTGNFGLQIAITDEYRSRTLFPVPEGTEGATDGQRFAPPFNTLGARVEIRIREATVSYQIRNALNREFEYVPGIAAPRPLSFYGVRWYFFN